MSRGTPSIHTFVSPTFEENAYVVSMSSSDSDPAGWVIDPGLGPQAETILEFLAGHSIRLERILLTHGHADHIAGVDTLCRAHPEVEVLISRPEHPMLSDPQLNLSAPFGFTLQVESPARDELEPGLSLDLGGSPWTVLDVSGHSPGGRAIYSAQAGVVFTGDALFCGSIGRTDLPGSSTQRLLANIRDNLLSLPDETVVYAGHGPTTTIGNERKSNPFLTDAH